MVSQLKYITSMHEQRQFSMGVIPKKGEWIEVGSFTPISESFDIHERWECDSVIKKDHQLIVDLHKLDHEADALNARKIIRRIMRIHASKLIASLRFMIIRGIINSRSYDKYDRIGGPTSVDTANAKLNLPILLPSEIKRSELSIAKKKLYAAKKRVKDANKKLLGLERYISRLKQK